MYARVCVSACVLKLFPRRQEGGHHQLPSGVPLPMSRPRPVGPLRPVPKLPPARWRQECQADVSRCPICHRTFKGQRRHRNYNLKTHMKIHANLKEFECHFCKATFRQKVHLQVHAGSNSCKKRALMGGIGAPSR